MSNLAQMEASLVEYLSDMMPGARVLAARPGHAAGRRTRTMQLDEVRVILLGVAGGIVRWRLEFAVGTHHPAARRREMLMEFAAMVGDGTAPWRASPPVRAAESDVAELWAADVEQPMPRPAAQPGPAIFAAATPVGTVAEIGPGHPMPAPDGELSLPARCLLVDAAGRVTYLGLVSTIPDSSLLHCEFAIPTGATAPATVLALGAGWMPGDTWREVVRWRPESYAPASVTLDGTPRRDVVGAPRHQVEWRCPLMAADQAMALHSAIKDFAGGAPVILVREAGAVAVAWLIEATFAPWAEGVLTWQTVDATADLLGVSP